MILVILQELREIDDVTSMHTEIFTDFKEFKVLTVLRIRSFTKSNFQLICIYIKCTRFICISHKIFKTIRSNKYLDYCIFCGPCTSAKIPEKRAP